jgi:hypothetical protein
MAPYGGYMGGPGGRRGEEARDPAAELAKAEEAMRQAKAEVARLKVRGGAGQGGAGRQARRRAR